MNAQVIAQAKLEDFTTFRLGGPCPYLIHCHTPQEIETVVKRLIAEKIPYILIGGGSNLVVSDRGLDCCVIRYYSQAPIVQREGNDVIVSGSTLLDDLVKFSIEQGLEGFATMSGIPGTVGGAVVGNAGAFGKQVGDFLKSATLLSLDGKIREALPAEIGFTYRNSLLKETGDIVLSVRFTLKPGVKEELIKQRAETLQLRHEKHPDLNIYPCAGSVFRNIEPTSKAEKRQAAGFFLEQAGGKNLAHGGAKIFDKHANIIVKGEGCKSQDVYELTKEMIRIVKDKFGIDLVREIRFVGKFDGMPETKSMMW